MVPEAINFAYNQLSIPTNSWRVFYDLKQSGTVIPSISGGQPQYSGIPSTFTTGVFSGQNIQISNADSLNAANWIMMFVFEKFNNNNAVLFSNYHGDVPKSGFAIGVNSANRLYLETFGNAGPDLHEIGIELGTRNAVAVSKMNNLVEFSYYNFNTKTVYTDGFLASNNSFIPSNEWYLGAAINPPGYYSGHPLDGKMEMYAYITGSIFPPQKAALFSGLTLAQAPALIFGPLGENCTYSYVGLTGQITDIVFNTIQTEIFCIESGYLVNNVGSIIGIVSGTVSGGSGIVSGYVSGSLTSGSGYTIPHTGFVSGFSGYQEIAVGVQIFQNTIPSGVKDIFIPFPNLIEEECVLFTELEDALLILTHQISEITPSGFSLSFSDFTNSNEYVLTTMVAPTQTDTDIKFFKTDVPIDSDNFYVQFPFDNLPNPKVFCQLENSEEEIFSYGISNVSESGFSIQFADVVEFPGLKVHVCATNLDNEQSFQILQTPLSSGVNSQLITFAAPFAQTPIIFGEITNLSGENIILHQITGANSGSFYAELPENLPSSNYTFNTLAWSGAQSGIGYIYSTGQQLTYLGQVTDVCQNIYNLSGLTNSLVITQYDLPLYKSIYFTGITGSIEQGTSGVNANVFYNVGYTIDLNTGQTANFTHQIAYQNDGSNFIRADHTLLYSGSQVQPDPFTVFKNCYQSYGYSLENYVYDTEYIYSFGMDGVHYLEEVDADDLSELYVFPYTHNKVNIDIDSIFDRTVREFFTYSIYSNDTLNIYLNGLALLGGGFRMTGDIYHRAPKLDFDYVVSGSYLFTNGLMDGGDDVVFDIISGNRKYRSVPQDYTNFSGQLFLRNMDIPNNDLYLNGVRLISGYDYIFNMVNNIASGVQIINTGLNSVSGIIFTLPIDSDQIFSTLGQFDYTGTPRFARGTSMLWANGIRQNLDEQYIEVSAISLLTGARNFDSGRFLIFNNDGTFWS